MVSGQWSVVSGQSGQDQLSVVGRESSLGGEDVTEREPAIQLARTQCSGFSAIPIAAGSRSPRHRSGRPSLRAPGALAGTALGGPSVRGRRPRRKRRVAGLQRRRRQHAGARHSFAAGGGGGGGGGSIGGGGAGGGVLYAGGGISFAAGARHRLRPLPLRAPTRSSPQPSAPPSSTPPRAAAERMGTSSGASRLGRVHSHSTQSWAPIAIPALT